MPEFYCRLKAGGRFDLIHHWQNEAGSDKKENSTNIMLRLT